MPDLIEPVLAPRWVSAHQPRRRLDRRVPLLIAGVCVVFAISYAIGHATTGGSAARVDASPSSQVASLNAAIPSALGAAAPLNAHLVIAAPRPAAHPSAPAPAAAPASTAVAAAPVQAPTPAPRILAPSIPAPVSAPVQAAPAPEASHQEGSSPSGGGGGSGSFDSSN